MDKRLVFGLVILALVAFAVLAFSPVAEAARAKQCSDGIDNDGDAKVDYPADPGCTSAHDDNEFNVWPNSCSDTDGGFVPTIAGTVSGYSGGAPYTNSDSCLNTTYLKEWYCRGVNATNSNYNCGGNSTCVGGRCV